MIKSVAVRASGLAAAAVLAVLPAGGSAQAAQTAQTAQTPGQTNGQAYGRAASAERTVVTVWTDAVGIPRTVKRGSTVTITIWFRQSSPDVMLPTNFGIDLWDRAAARGSMPHAATASWLDPVTHRWTPGEVFSQSWMLALSLSPHVVQTPSNPIRVLPDHWGHVQVRLTFARTATPGTWTIETSEAAVFFRGAESDLPTVHWVNSADPGAFPVYTFKLT